MDSWLEYAALIVPAACAVVLLFYPVRDKRGRVTVLGWCVLALSVASMACSLMQKQAEVLDRQQRVADADARLRSLANSIDLRFEVRVVNHLSSLAYQALPRVQADGFNRLVSLAPSAGPGTTDEAVIQAGMAPLLPILTDPDWMERVGMNCGVRDCTHLWREHLVRDFSHIADRLSSIEQIHRAEIPFVAEEKMRELEGIARNCADIYRRKDEASEAGARYLRRALPAYLRKVSELTTWIDREVREK